MSVSNLRIIVAVADRLAIGRNGALLFHIPDDMRRFRMLTTGHPVIMGRKTFESLPSGPLPRRRNIVISANPDWSAPGVEVVDSLPAAIELVEGDDAFVIGGSRVYRDALPLADTIYLTRIYADDPDADVFFPEFENDWTLVDNGPLCTDPKTGISFRFRTFKRL